MSTVRTFNTGNSLAGKMARPGGRTMAEAVRAAETGLESHRESGMRSLAATLELLEAACAARQEEGGARIYELASGFADMAGFFATGPLYAAAFSLCETSDRMLAGACWRWPLAEVHVRAIRLILSDGCRDNASSRTLLDGLAAVVGKLGR